MAFVPPPLSDTDYDAMTRTALASVEATVDRFLQDDIVDIDANRTGSMLELVFPGGATIVVNAQPPLHELWLAAPMGGFHFKPSGSAWIDGRDGREFFAVLSECASALAGVDLSFAA